MSAQCLLIFLEQSNHSPHGRTSLTSNKRSERFEVCVRILKRIRFDDTFDSHDDLFAELSFMRLVVEWSDECAEIFEEMPRAPLDDYVVTKDEFCSPWNILITVTNQSF